MAGNPTSTTSPISPSATAVALNNNNNVTEEATLEQECMAAEETHQFDLIVMPRRSARKLSATLLLLALKLLDRGKRTT